MGIAISLGHLAEKRTNDLNDVIQKLEQKLSEKEHCINCKFIDTIYCGGMLDRESLKVTELNKPNFCSSFFEEEKIHFFNLSTIKEIKE